MFTFFLAVPTTEQSPHYAMNLNDLDTKHYLLNSKCKDNKIYWITNTSTFYFFEGNCGVFFKIFSSHIHITIKPKRHTEHINTYITSHYHHD